jgi:hypothetical protein
MTYKKFQIEDCDQTVDLLNLCFTDTTISRESFLWKHFDPFFESKTVAYIAIKDEIIVGFVCFTPFTNNVTDKDFWVCAVQATHPDYRRQGIVKELTKLCESDIGQEANYVGFSNASGVKIDQNSKSIQYAIIGQIHQAFVLPHFFKSNLEFSEVEDFANFTNDAKLVTFLKDQQYVNWRYKFNPKVKYKFVTISQDSKVVANCIFSVGSKFMELRCLDSKVDSSCKNLIKAIANYCLFKKTRLLKIAYLPNSFWDQTLPLTCVRTQLERYLTVKSPDQRLLNKDNWYILGGDNV